MGSYLDYLKTISGGEASSRKRDYLAHNFSSFLSAGQAVLEIGPGLGDFIAFAKERGAAAIDIIERDPAIAEHLKERFAIRRSFILELENLDAHEEQLGDYHCIFMLQVLEHVRKEKTVDIIRALYRHLAPGGVLIVTVPNGGNPLSAVERYSDFTHEVLFSENSLRQIAGFAGLEEAEVEVRGYAIPPTGVINLLRIAVQKLLHLVLTAVLIANGGVYFRVLEPNLSLIVKKPGASGR